MSILIIFLVLFLFSNPNIRPIVNRSQQAVFAHPSCLKIFKRKYLPRITFFLMILFFWWLTILFSTIKKFWAVIFSCAKVVGRPIWVLNGNCRKQTMSRQTKKKDLIWKTEEKTIKLLLMMTFAHCSARYSF